MCNWLEVCYFQQVLEALHPVFDDDISLCGCSGLVSDCNEKLQK